MPITLENIFKILKLVRAIYTQGDEENMILDKI